MSYTPSLHFRFRAWCRTAPRRLDVDGYAATNEGAQALIEDAMWHAYQAGYDECMNDVRRAFKLPAELDTKKPTP